MRRNALAISVTSVWAPFAGVALVASMISGCGTYLFLRQQGLNVLDLSFVGVPDGHRLFRAEH
jgi:hypothetical protein